MMLRRRPVARRPCWRPSNELWAGLPVAAFSTPDDDEDPADRCPRIRAYAVPLTEPDCAPPRPAGRTCGTCSTVLSVYNLERFCAVCSRAGRPGEALLVLAMLHDVFVASVFGLPAPPEPVVTSTQPCAECGADHRGRGGLCSLCGHPHRRGCAPMLCSCDCWTVADSVASGRTFEAPSLWLYRSPQ